MFQFHFGSIRPPDLGENSHESPITGVVAPTTTHYSTEIRELYGLRVVGLLHERVLPAFDDSYEWQEVYARQPSEEVGDWQFFTPRETSAKSIGVNFDLFDEVAG